VSENPLKLKRLHHAEYWVGNAKQAAYYYSRAFGFSRFAFQGLETGNRDRASYALRQSQARIVLTAPLGPDSPVNDFLRQHGDGVKDLAFEVENVDFAYEEALRRGARGAIEPTPCPTRTAASVTRPSTPTATPSIPSTTCRTTAVLFFPGTPRAKSKSMGPGSC